MFYARCHIWRQRINGVLKATSQSNGNGQTSTPHKIKNPLTDYKENFAQLIMSTRQTSSLTQKNCANRS